MFLVLQICVCRFLVVHKRTNDSPDMLTVVLIVSVQNQCSVGEAQDESFGNNVQVQCLREEVHP